MRAIFPLTIISLIVLLGATVNADEKPIKINAHLTKPVNSVVKVVVEIDLADGWHAYESTDDSNPARVLDIKLDLPDGIVAAGPWQRPEPTPGDDGSYLYAGTCHFSREICIVPEASSQQIGVTVLYQICNVKTCQRPAKFQIDLDVPAAKPGYKFKNEYFETPMILMADGSPLNEQIRQGYISPSLYDIDNDGTLELLTGDVAGKVRVYKNENGGQGEPVWADDGFLLNTSSSNIIAKNW